jgi:hypothetical protein
MSRPSASRARGDDGDAQGPGNPWQPTMRERGTRADRAHSVAASVPSRSDAVTAAALVVVRRALIEGAPVTRKRLAEEASFALGTPPHEALREVDAIAQRLGVSSLG